MYKVCWLAIIAMSIGIFLSGCGGGGTTQPLAPGPLPHPDHQHLFDLSVSPASASLFPGVPKTFVITVRPLGGFTGDISLAISGNTQGISISSLSRSHIQFDGNTTLAISTFSITASTTTPGSELTNMVLITGTSHAGNEQTVIFVTAHH